MPKLAINGGPQAASNLRIPPWPQLTTADKIAVLQALEDRQWCFGPVAREFATAMAKAHDARHGITVSNGTTALQLALRAAGVAPGDEVICPAVTFIATASAIAEVGAIPVFADIDPETAQIDVASVEAIITDKTTAVLGVHYGGYPFDLDALRKLCKRRSLRLIEDCAHAQGTEWRGRKVGAIGDCSGMSLQQSKGLAAGEGGIVLTDDDAIYERGFLIHNIGRTSLQTGVGHHILSSNYRMHEIEAALALSALKRMPREVALRHRNGEWLADQMRTIGGIDPLKPEPRCTQHGYYFFVLRYDARQWNDLPRDRFLAALRAEGVLAGTGYGIPLYRNTAFDRDRLQSVFGVLARRLPNYRRLHLPAAEAFCAEQQMTLSHPHLMAKRSELRKIVNAVTKIKEHMEEVPRE